MGDSAAPSVEETQQDKGSNIITTGVDQEPSTPSQSEKAPQDGELNPQPTSDPNDPLNWSVLKKHLFLFIISVVAFLPDYGSSTGAITNLVQPLYLPLTADPSLRKEEEADKKLPEHFTFPRL